MSSSSSSSTTANPDKWVYYRYDPSSPAAIVFMVLFGALALLHIYQLSRTRTWFMIPFAIGTIFEFIGYTGRLISSHQTPDWTLGAYTIQTIFLLVAPALFAASIYMELGRIIHLTEGETHALIRRTRLTKIFVCGDVLSFVVQAAGAGIMAGHSLNSLNTGEKIIIVGLVIQLLFFGLFLGTAILFHVRIHKSPTPRTAPATLFNQPPVPWLDHIYTLYASSVIILIRSIFRVIEYGEGNSGYLMSHEAFLYIFDAVLMFGVVLLFNIVHPSEINAWLRGGRFSTKAGLELKVVSTRVNGDGE